MRKATLLLVALAVAAVLASQLSVGEDGTPVFYRGREVGCAEHLAGLASELAGDLGRGVIYIFGIRGCPDCAEMENYLKEVAGLDVMVYVDVIQYRNYYERLTSVLAGYVDSSYISEVPIVLVVKDGVPVVVHVGVYRNDTYWIQVISGNYQGTCVPTPREHPSTTLAGALFGAVAAGLATAFSPCILYLYMALLLSYSTTSKSLRDLLLFVAGLGSGYLAIVFGLSSILSIVRPYSWVLFIGFGAYMVAHSRGLLGCLVGGRSCRDLGYQRASTSAAASSFPLILGVLASVSAVPCGAGYFVLLQSAVGGGSTAEMLLVLMAYIGSFLAPYVVASILSSRMVRTLEKISGKIALVELAGGLALISIGMYLALRKV